MTLRELFFFFFLLYLLLVLVKFGIFYAFLAFV